MQMKSRNAHPPSGWVYYQPETGWTAPAWQSFDSLVLAVMQHRKANAGRFPQLSHDKATVEMEVDAYNAERMKSIPGGMAFVADGGSAPPGFPTSHLLRQSVGQLVAGAKNVVAGIGLWTEFFGSDPVEQTLANERAKVCVDCPHNAQGDIFQRFSAKTGEELKAIFAGMKKQAMETPSDPQLAVCVICSCPTRAKVWAPLEILNKHTRPEIQAALPEWCWIKKELSTLST
jgi:hypothetical protein